MAISSIGNQGQTPMAGVEKNAAADTLKHKAQPGTEKPAEASRVNISSEALKKIQEAKAAEQKAAAQKVEEQKAEEQKAEVQNRNIRTAHPRPAHS